MNLLQTKLYLKDTPGGTKLFMDDQKKTGEKYPVPVQRQELSRDLAGLPLKDLDSVEVDYEKEMGRPVRIRRTGQPWQSQGSAPPAIQTAQKGGSQQGAPSRPRPHGQRPARTSDAPGHNPHRESNQPPLSYFHNPYNFIPALPRNAIAESDPLGDSKPKGHHRYHADHWSGRIVVKLTTVTPLLIPDAALADYNNEGHGTFPVRVDRHGVPYLPPTSIKGMLRSAYEVVTNSRLGVFQGHEERLAYRMDPRKGLKMVPARVEEQNGCLQIQLMPGSSRPTETEPQGPMYAAWLGRYGKHRNNHLLSFKHGQKVWAFINLWRHTNPVFEFWNVVDLRPYSDNSPSDSPIENRQPWEKASPREPAKTLGWVCGYVFIPNRNFGRKHDERVFFLDEKNTANPKLKISLNKTEQKELAQSWRELIDNYRDCHDEKEIWHRRRPDGQEYKPNDYITNKPGQTAWSRHIYEKDSNQLLPETLCYSEIRENDEKYEILRLYPVMIARELYQLSPDELLNNSIKPAATINQLSPAERVFGWVNPDGNGAFRGQLRVGPVTCEQGAKAIVHFPEPGHPLPILGAPKPQQSRFYAARLENGEPLPLREGMAKHTGYAEGGGLRGRKVYPHHAHLAKLPQYWDNPTEDRTSREIRVNVNGETQTYFQEYRRPDPQSNDIKLRDDQNRSLLGWIKEGIEFKFTLDMVNLSTVELGALLYLLKQPDGYFRLGGGKPFGFGSVELEIVTLDIRDGMAWKAYYQDLISTTEQTGERITHQDEDRIEKMIADYKEAITRTYSKGRIFEEILFIKGFIAMTKGFSNCLPVHYPRTALNPQPAGENFKWFVANEKDTREIRNRRKSLPELETTASGLPLWPDE